MRFQSPRGMPDVLPEDQAYWRAIIKNSEKLARTYGYERLDPPIVEDTGLFLRSIGEGTDIHDKEMYLVGLAQHADKFGELALRPEFTAGVMRAYIEHGFQNKPAPVRLYSLGPAFRHEAPQLGRTRQFSQLNVEAVGSMDPALDLEVMLVAWQFYLVHGIPNLSFQLNSTGCPKCRPQYVQALRDYYQGHIDQVSAEDRHRLEVNPLRVLDSKAENAQALIEAAVGGSPRFFLGTDSAPHERHAKENACGCAGIYSAHAGIELYAEAFEAAGALPRLEAFAAHFGADFYGLPRNSGTITLVKAPWSVPASYPFGEGTLVPWRAGERLAWQIETQAAP